VNSLQPSGLLRPFLCRACPCLPPLLQRLLPRQWTDVGHCRCGARHGRAHQFNGQKIPGSRIQRSHVIFFSESRKGCFFVLPHFLGKERMLFRSSPLILTRRIRCLGPRGTSGLIHSSSSSAEGFASQLRAHQAAQLQAEHTSTVTQAALKRSLGREEGWLPHTHPSAARAIL